MFYHGFGITISNKHLNNKIQFKCLKATELGKMNYNNNSFKKIELSNYRVKWGRESLMASLLNHRSRGSRPSHYFMYFANRLP